jgi:hypothetical protein
MSAGSVIHMPHVAVAAPQTEGLELAATIYALATYKPGCVDYPGQQNCQSTGCGRGDDEFDAKGNAVRDLAERFPVIQGPKRAAVVSKAVWERDCAAAYLNQALSQLF